MLSPPSTSEKCPVSADKFQAYFHKKVEDIRKSTADRLFPVINALPQPGLCEFREVTVKDVVRLLTSSPSKSSRLDVIPTWLLKEMKEVFLPFLTRLINSSLQAGSMPHSAKQANVRRILTKNRT